MATTQVSPAPATGVVRRPAMPSPAWRRAVDKVFSTDNAIRLITLVVIVVAWQWFASTTRPISFPSLLPKDDSPLTVWNGMVQLINDGRLASAWIESIGLLVGALAISTTTGVTLGIVFGRYRLVDEFFAPVVTGLFMTPRVAVIPIIALWFGFGTPAKLIVIFLFSFFEIFYTVRDGVRTTDAQFVEVAKAYNVSEWTMLTKVILPASLPFVVTGLRLGMLHGFVGLVLAGFFLENNGIGGLIFNEGTNFKAFSLIAALFTVAVVGVCLNFVLHRLERRVAPWRGAAVQ